MNNMYFLIGKSENTINNYTAIFTMAQTLVLLGSVPFTEIALHKNFDKDGNRKN